MNRSDFLAYDEELMQEMNFRIKSGQGFKNGTIPESTAGMSAGVAEFIAPDMGGVTTEAVILDFLRPCLLIKNNSFSLAESDVWKGRLEPYRKVIEQRIPSVGRVEFKYHPRFKWGGTGWLIAPNMVITNRHVAQLFATSNAGGISISTNSLGNQIVVSLDFNEEYGSDRAAIDAGVDKVIYLADQGLPDIAILQLSPGARTLEPIPVSTNELKAKSELAVIGYPAYDPYRNPLKPADVTRIFNDIFEYKRLSPGLLLNESYAPGVFTHDATTLGGNSGSVVLDYKTGHAIGLHFSGVFHEENFAVTPGEILKALSGTGIALPVSVAAVSVPVPETDKIEQQIAVEAPIESYTDRLGYVENFLGPDHMVDLPVVADKDNIVRFGDDESVLKYHHFSVQMNSSRRMCFYSAVNINGLEALSTKRPGWRLDPRIDEKSQIIGECYGNAPKFSRGHMTRREDPAWGKTRELATLGNADSMHVTNTVPQMQPFNAGIWLGLEQYALQNAKDDKMNISVFTGPFFTDNDPERYGIRIPLDFWKIIVFINNDTGKLCATGYTMSQRTFLQTEEFVYGQYDTYQTSIKSIEQRGGISFGNLSAIDPYVGLEVLPVPLTDLTQIRFK